MPVRSMVYLIVVAAGLFALYFFKLGAFPLIDPDEPVYAQTAKEMALGGGWITPHYEGRPWFDKPPLFYWLSGVAVSALGPTELACRLASAVPAVGLVLLVYLLAAYDFGPRAGFLSAAVIATCLQQIVLAHAAVTDMTLVFCLTGSLYAYRRWLDAEGRGRFAWAALCGIMAGLGMMTKGPVALVLLGATFIVSLWWTGRIKRLGGIDAVLGLVTAVVVGGAWYLTMYARHGDAFVEGFLVANNIARFLKAEHVSQTGGWYSYFLNAPILLIFFFPWSMFLLQGMSRYWRANDGARLATAWFAVVFVFFSLSKTILTTYIFPLYPAAALFVGALWNSALSGDAAAAKSARKGVWAGFFVSILVAGLAFGSARERCPEATLEAAVLGIIPVAAFAIAIASIFLRKNGDVAGSFRAMTMGMIVFTLWLMAAVMPIASPWGSTRELARRISRVAGACVAVYDLERPSIFFYLGRKPERITDPTEAGRLLMMRTPAFILCKKHNAPVVQAPGSILWAKSGEVVVIANASASAADRRRND